MKNNDALKSDPSASAGNRKVRNGLRAIVTAAALTALAAACSTGDDAESSVGEDHPQATAAPADSSPRPAPETTTTTITPEQLAREQRQMAEAYASSPERNQAFEDLVAKYGPRIVEAIQTRKFGPWDAFNIETGNYRSQVRGEAGWVNMWHSPEYGGSGHAIGASVYQNADGSFDLAKGIMSLSIQLEGGRSVDLESPLRRTLDGYEPDTGWHVTISTPSPTDESYDYDRSGPNDISTYGLNADQVQAIDQDALATFEQSMVVIGLADK